MKKWRLLTSILIITSFFFMSSVVQVVPKSSPAAQAAGNPQQAAGNPQAGSWIGTVCVGNGGLSQDVATIQGFACLIANGLNAILTLFSFVGFLMFVYASFMLMISGGNPNGYETARNTFTYAVFGFILALSSFVIIQLISYYTGLNTFMTIKFLSDTVGTS